MKFRWLISTVCLVLAIGAALLVRSTLASPVETETNPRAPNPHWKSDGCSRCHGEGQPQDIAHARATALCTHCHDGVRAPEEVHPVGRTFDGDQVVLPEGWPAPEGKLSCLTCHDILLQCDRDRQRPEFNPSFLRDYAGPSLVDHCARCHVAAAKTKGQRYNPHKMLDESGQPVAHACAFCHTEGLDVWSATNRYERQAQPALRADGISLCVRCHRSHKDYFEPGHIGLTVSEEFKTGMAFRQPPLAGRIEEATATQPAPTGLALLPLQDGKRIVCSTCHNPHQKGVFPATSILGAGAMIVPGAARGDAPLLNRNARLPRRGLGANVCLGCHEK